MNLQSRILFMLSSLIISGYIASPVLSVAATTGKPTTSHRPHSPSKPTTKSQNNQNNDDQDENEDPDEDNKNPTQSLFEAINTGNIREVQDSLNRGADLRATNVLGQTPLEMSIDLNRDRITFLLLSMRGYNNSPQSLASKEDITTVSVKNNKGHLSIKGKNQHGSAAIQNSISPYGHNGGGIAKPEIGFLGFQRS